MEPTELLKFRHEAKNITFLIQSRLEQMLQKMDRGVLTHDSVYSEIVKLLGFTQRLTRLCLQSQTERFSGRCLTAGALFEELEQFVLCDLEKFGIEFEYDSQEIPIDFLESDVELFQALLNLVLNSIQVLKSALSPKISLSAARVFNAIEFRVMDNGPGLPAEVLKKPFEPKVTAHSNGSNFGIGLSIVKGSIERLGGNVFLEPRTVGTCFVISVPYYSLQS